MIAEGGSEAMSYGRILDAFYPMAAGLYGGARKEVTTFVGDVHRDNLDAYTAIVVGLLTKPRFAPEDFERLRNEAIDELTKTLRGSNDEELGKWTLQTRLYDRTSPYGHVDRGTVAGLRSITRDDVRAFHAANYTRARLHLGVAGGTDRAYVDRLTRALEVLPAGGSTPTLDVKQTAPRDGLKVTIVEKPAEASAISIGAPIAVTRADDDFYALAVANSYLGEHRTFNGKLMQDLRGERGLNYGDYSYIEDFIQEGGGTFPISNNPRRVQYFSIWIRPVPADKTVFALRAALWEWRRLVDKGMTEAEFEATRSFLLNYSKLWVQTPSRRLGYAMDGVFYGRDDVVTELARRLPKLTVADVNNAVRKHLSFPGFEVAVVAKDAPVLERLLRSGKPTPITYDTEGTPADVLAEDREIAVFPLERVDVRIIPVAEMFEK
jgi:zinc protease